MNDGVSHMYEATSKIRVYHRRTTIIVKLVWLYRIVIKIISGSSDLLWPLISATINWNVCLDSLTRYYSISIANALEVLLSCAKSLVGSYLEYRLISHDIDSSALVFDAWFLSIEFHDIWSSTDLGFHEMVLRTQYLHGVRKLYIRMTPN